MDFNSFLRMRDKLRNKQYRYLISVDSTQFILSNLIFLRKMLRVLPSLRSQSHNTKT